MTPPVHSWTHLRSLSSSGTPQATRDSVGRYQVDVTVDVGDADDLWRWWMEGIGANPQIVFGEFKVLLRPFMAA